MSAINYEVCVENFSLQAMVVMFRAKQIADYHCRTISVEDLRFTVHEYYVCLQHRVSTKNYDSTESETK